MQLVVQTAVVNFVEWMRDPSSDVGYTAQAFEVVPQDLQPADRAAPVRSRWCASPWSTSRKSCHCWPRNEEQLTALTAGILRYSRDLAFAAATAYADQAEARGAWDTRMEANVVDAVVRGDVGPELQSQAAALNWDATAPGDRHRRAAAARTGSDHDRRRRPRDRRRATARRHCPTCTAPGWWPSCRAACPRPTSSSANCSSVFADGPRRSSARRRSTLGAAHRSATEAIAGMNAVAGWSGAPRPVSARELLPERALLGDATRGRRPGRPRSCARWPTPVRRSPKPWTPTWTPAAR